MFTVVRPSTTDFVPAVRSAVEFSTPAKPPRTAVAAGSAMVA